MAPSSAAPAPVRARFAAPLAAQAVGFVGAALLSAVTSQGYLHAVVVTGAGYTGSTTPAGPLEQAAMVAAWVVIGAVAGFVGRRAPAFGAAWLGALLGSAVGFLADPQDNVLWMDVVVTVAGVTVFLVPGFFIGALVAAGRERLEPDGSGRRPPPSPLWTRGARAFGFGPGEASTAARPDAAIRSVPDGAVVASAGGVTVPPSGGSAASGASAGAMEQPSPWARPGSQRPG